MLDADPVRVLHGGIMRPEGSGALEMARVGAAANRERLARPARVLLIRREQGADLGQLGVHVEGRHVAPLLVAAAELDAEGRELGAELVARDARGVAAVDRLDELVADGTHGAAD